jgi:hypothetical protein
MLRKLCFSIATTFRSWVEVFPYIGFSHRSKAVLGLAEGTPLEKTPFFYHP